MAQTVVPTEQVWRPLKIGGGGYVTKMDVADDGRIIIATDTYGGYVRDPSDAEWRQFKTAYTMPAGDVYYSADPSGTYKGIYDCQICKTNSDIMYMVSSELPYRSDDGGETWTLINNGFAARSDSQMDPNAQSGFASSRLHGPFMAVDPLNEDVVYLGNGKRLYRTLDGGANWAVCSGISDATNFWPGVSGLVIDKSSSTASGVTRKSVVMVWVHGRGWYRSTDGGDTFSLLGVAGPGYPDNASAVDSVAGNYRIMDAVCTESGIILATDNTDVWRYSGGTWSNIGGVTGANYLAVDPFDDDRVISISGGAILSECLDITATTPVWGSEIDGTDTKDGMDQPWVAVEHEVAFMACGRTMFHPTIQNRIVLTHGTGMWYADVAPGFSTVPWKNWTTGIENLVGIQIRKFAGNKHLYCICYDRGLFISGNPEAYASETKPPIDDDARREPLKWGSCVAAPDDNSDMILALMSYGSATCLAGKSLDQGETWAELNLPPIWFVLYGNWNAAATTSGSPTVTINVTAHGLSVGSWVTFVMATAFADVDLNGKAYQVASVPNANSFTITYATNASATVTAGGGNVYYTTYHESNKFSCTDGSGIVTAVLANGTSQFSIGGAITFYNTTSIGGLDLNGRQSILSVSGGTITFAPGGTANATVSNGGGTNFGYYVDWQKGKVPPSTQIVASTETNYIMVGGSTRLAPHYTTDGGATWAPCSFPTELSLWGWSFAYFQQRNVIDSDPNNPGTFYAFHYQGGLYRSTDGGANFTQMSSDTFTTGNWHAQLICVPGHAGHLFWSDGAIGGDPGTTQEGNARFSTDGGATWDYFGVENLGDPDPGEIQEVNWLSIGAVKPGSSYPTIWLSGWINGEYGIYYCTDADPTTTGKWTWNSVEAHPMGWLDFITGMQADPDSWHTCYVAFNGSGWTYTTQTDVTRRTFEITT